MSNVKVVNKKKVFKILKYFVLIFLAIIWFVPIFTVIMTSIKSQADYYSGMGLFDLPSKIYWQNYVEAFKVGHLGTFMKNGLFVSFLKVPIGIFVAALAAYAIARLPVKGKSGIFVFFLLGMMLPFQVALVPLNVVYRKLNLINTYFGLFYAYVGFGISYAILILRGFFKAIPREIDQAALIDGCNKFELFSRIILPISKPALATLFIIDFLATWNEYLLASVIINDFKMKTVSSGLMYFIGEQGTGNSNGLLSAGMIITIIPVLIVFIFFQRYFVEGLSGAVKS
jgi:raffinose/stachyose/melibiose transport system permease protein